MTTTKPSSLNGAPIPHEAATEELLELIKAPPPDCGPAFIALGCRQDPQALYALINATKDSDWQKRRFAAAALRYHPAGKRALPAIEPLLTDEKPEVVSAASETMAELGLMSERLVYLLQLDNPKTRTAALKALTKLGHKQVFAYVLKVFERETFPEPRDAAAAFLEQFADDSNWHGLAKQWAKDVQPGVRVKAVHLVAKHGTTKDVDLVSDMLDDKDMNVRRAAYQALVKLEG